MSNRGWGFGGLLSSHQQLNSDEVLSSALKLDVSATRPSCTLTNQSPLEPPANRKRGTRVVKGSVPTPVEGKPLSGTAKGGKETADGVQVTVGKPLTTGLMMNPQPVNSDTVT
ncbi:hypothetical protein GCK32_016258 [Trichostrongylus colubriformis]|uniref:Uncharacterized protein n=1 Tax=Trichostrongylus colubriformis TaxID=6319 RepID=A0AAN8FVP7_TRICO